MRKHLAVLTAALLLLASLSGCAVMGKPVAAGTSDRPELAVTSVAICQILDRLGYDKVIGVPQTSGDLPARYAGLPAIGAPMTPDYEVLKKLNPSLVLSPKSLEDSLSKGYTAAGLSSAFLDLSSVEGMYKAIASLGSLLSCEERAQALVDEYEAYMDAYRTQGGEAPDVLLLMAFPDGFYLVATENSYVGNLVALAGGKNVYGKDTRGDENGFVSINPEDMLQRNPDLILVFAHYNEESAFSYMRGEFADSAAWQHYDAVKQGRTHYLPSGIFGMSATLSWTQALDHLKPILYGE